jgi:ABC-type bacteriocin/lantibiotic exporter with double-glycine peptidase domain
VQVHNVWHRYRPESPWVLSDFSQDYAAGSYTVLRAASGAGKSTLLRLIAGLLTPEHGRLLVCGRDPSTTEELVAYVPQQTLLLDASIAANLSALSGGRMQQARAVAERTGLTQLLARLPMGEETLISGAGSNLSAGQRQLITLTAAFATEQPVLLLDEVVSQLDSHSRELIDWGALTKDRTVISVQHF